MTKKTEEFFETLQEYMPLTREEYMKNVRGNGEVLETVLLEDVFMPPILSLLIENKDLELLKKIFDFFEDVVRGDDLHLKNILTITVLEILGNDIKILEIAKKYMGPQTTLLQKKADKDLGRR